MKTQFALGIVIVLTTGFFFPLWADESYARRSSLYADYPSLATIVNRAEELTEKGEYEKARLYYTAGIAQDPKAWPCYFGRAAVLERQRKWLPAIEDYGTVLRLVPGLLFVQVMRGQVYELLGQYGRALADYERIIKIAPESVPYNRAFALNSRAWLRSTCSDAAFRDAKSAVADAKHACQYTAWSEPSYIDTLAAAHAEAGDFESATRFQRRAIDRLREPKYEIKNPEERHAFHESRLAAYQARLASYQRHQAWRAK
ncbi:MAG: tetratricopeptide repeat protein [Chthoniobacterales bacterium]